ncbi:MAG: chemotaxis protein CheA [Anaerolineales bacterium]|nr:chemotaxis protein CheA [Anaerolineales bacterium]
MNTFDITDEERQILLAETDEQLQTLEGGLLELEQVQDPALVQALFRAAHTLKGSAGMIGHTQIVELTHALETVFDDLRQDRLAITSPLVDICLQSVDKLKLLRNDLAGFPIIIEDPAPPLAVPPASPEATVPLTTPALITLDNNKLSPCPPENVFPTSGQDKTIRASVERLDNLLNLVGELITDRNRLIQLYSHLDTRTHADKAFLPFNETIVHLDGIVNQLQEEVLGLRMLPIATVFNKFPRLIRDLARRANKSIELVMDGADTELDRSVLEQISDPLIHLLRNAVDHGIEPPDDRLAAGKPEHGTIHLAARHENGQIKITLKDDGQGIPLQKVKNRAIQQGLLTEKEAAVLTNNEAIELIFHPGLSTAPTINEISGRGVGMDIVRTNIETLNGTILTDTWPGEGTQFELLLPLTLAIIPTLLVRAGPDCFAIPLLTVAEAFRLHPETVQSIQGKPTLLFRGNLLPLVNLHEILGSQPDHDTPPLATLPQQYIVSVRTGKTQFGLVVDALIGEEEVMVKSLGRLAGRVPGVAGAAILGDGSVVLILDIPSLIKSNLLNNTVTFIHEMPLGEGKIYA